MKSKPAILALVLVLASGVPRDASPQVVNEVVTDPQQDWNDSSGGDGLPFSATPGDGGLSEADEWVELFNNTPFTLDLTGWTLLFLDTTPEQIDFGGAAGSTLFIFSGGSSLGAFQPGGYLVIGNPPGAMNNDIWVVLSDSQGFLIDDVEIGDDPEQDGAGDGAPNGNASGVADEVVARIPNALDTDFDPDDFRKAAATIGRSNPSATGVDGRPATAWLLEIRPNPVSAVPRVVFTVPRRAEVSLTVHDLAGRQLAELAHAAFEPGRHETRWSTPDVASGIYWVRFEAADESGSRITRVRKLAVMR